MSEPRFTAVPNHHARTRKDWPWAVLDTNDDTLCAFASNQETALTTAAGLNRHIGQLGNLPDRKRTLRNAL